MLRPDFTVVNLSELSTLYTADIQEGANVWVDSDGAYWTLEKNSGAVVGPTIIAPIAGAPSAGAINARWVRNAGAPAGGAFTGPDIVYRPGAVGVLPGNVVTTWAALRALFATTAGLIDIELDNSLGATIAPPGVWDFEGRASFVAPSNIIAPVLFDVQDGAVILNPLRFKGGFVAQFSGTVLNGLAFNIDGQTFYMEDQVQITAVGGIPAIAVGATLVIIQMSTFAIISDGTNFIDTSAGTAIIHVISSAYLGANSVTATGGSLTIAQDSSSVNNVQSGVVVGYNAMFLNGGIMRYHVNLTNGRSATLVAPGLSTTSTIVPDFVTPVPGIGGLTRDLAALGADRSFGSGSAGTFIVTAINDAGTLQNLDQSAIEVTVFL